MYMYSIYIVIIYNILYIVLKACETTYQDDNGERIPEDVNLDEDTQTELTIKKSNDGNIEAVAKIDYKKVS